MSSEVLNSSADEETVLCTQACTTQAQAESPQILARLPGWLRTSGSGCGRKEGGKGTLCVAPQESAGEGGWQTEVCVTQDRGRLRPGHSTWPGPRPASSTQGSQSEQTAHAGAGVGPGRPWKTRPSVCLSLLRSDTQLGQPGPGSPLAECGRQTSWWWGGGLDPWKWLKDHGCTEMCDVSSSVVPGLRLASLGAWPDVLSPPHGPLQARGLSRCCTGLTGVGWVEGPL